MAETPQTANYISETDFLSEAGAILREETRKLPTIEHLKAMAVLVNRARQLLATELGTDGWDAADPQSIADWFREAKKSEWP